MNSAKKTIDRSNMPVQEKPEAIFYDIEANETVTESQLRKEYQEFREEQPEETPLTFGEYLGNCMTYNGGTLERYDSRKHEKTHIFIH